MIGKQSPETIMKNRPQTKKLPPASTDILEVVNYEKLKNITNEKQGERMNQQITCEITAAN